MVQATPYVANSECESLFVANFEAIRCSIENEIKRVAYRSGTLQREDIEDLIQDSWLDVLTSLHQFNPEKGCKVHTWAGRIAHNNAIDGGKGNTKTRLRNISLEDCVNGLAWNSIQREVLRKTENSDCADFVSISKDDEVEKRGLVKNIREYISSLTQRDQLFVKMLIDGVSYEDMAKTANCTVATAYNAVYRIRTKLRIFRNSNRQNAA
mgnify:CR=1 FL=1